MRNQWKVAAAVAAVLVVGVVLYLARPGAAGSASFTSQLGGLVPGASARATPSPSLEGQVSSTPAAGGATRATPSPHPTLPPAPSQKATQPPPSAQPPKPGTYQYQGTASSGATTLNIDASTTISDEVQKGSETDFTESTSLLGRSGSSHVAWRPASAVQLDQQSDASSPGSPAGGGGGGSCTWSPPLLLLEFPLHSGQKWNIDSTCMDASGKPTEHIKGAADVGDALQATVGGTRVVVLPIHAVTTTTSGSGSGSVMTDLTEYFATAYGIPTRLSGRTTSTQSSGQTQEFTFEAQLKSLQPS